MIPRVAADVGGTFTDLVCWLEEGQRFAVHKVPSTPTEPATAVLGGLDELCRQVGTTIADVEQVLHGTTVGTNVILERKGSRVGLLTTEGFRDVLHIARHRRPLNFSLHQEIPWQKHPLVKRRDRLTVKERIAGLSGEVIEPLDEEEVRARVRGLRESGAESVAVCFLFSFLRPEHEQRAAEIVREEWPEVWLSTSSSVISKMREYERFSTTCLDAYVGPKVSGYIRTLDARLHDAGYHNTLQLMTSSGGLLPAARAAERPVSLLLSGPVAGLLGGIWVGQTAGEANVISLDVGGTSADIGVAPGGETRLKHVTNSSIAGHATIVPMVDVDTIGAGGGSMAVVADDGIFSVGPESAGADPGPACYGRGGRRPTVTDAALVSGILSATRPLGGTVSLSLEAGRDGIARGVAEPLGASVEEAACGVLAILTQNMVQAIELNSIRKGYDPRDFALVGIGGAGPMFSVAIARELGVPRVVVPPHPGIGAAMGLLATDTVYDLVAAIFGRIGSLDLSEVRALYDGLTDQAVGRFEEDGVPEDRRRIVRYVECRFSGQAYEIRVEAASGDLDGQWVADVVRRFETEFRGQVGTFDPDAEVEFVAVGVRAIGLMPPLRAPLIPKATGGSEEALTARRPVWFARGAEVVAVDDVGVYDRGRLAGGHKLAGPAIVEQFDTTVVINPGSTAVVDDVGNIVITIGG